MSYSKSKYNILILLVILLLPIFISCNKDSDELKELKNLLLQYKISMSAKEHYYFLLNGQACGSCSSTTADEFVKYYNNDRTLITCDKSIYSRLYSNKIPSENLVYDKNKHLLRMKLNSSGITVLKIRDNKILAVMNVNPQNLEKLKNFIK